MSRSGQVLCQAKCRDLKGDSLTCGSSRPSAATNSSRRCDRLTVVRSRGSAHARALPEDGLLLEQATITADDLLHGLARLRAVGMNQQQHFRALVVDGASRCAPLPLSLPDGEA